MARGAQRKLSQQHPDDDCREDFIDQIRSDDGDGDGLNQVLTDRVHPGDKKIGAAASDTAEQSRANRHGNEGHGKRDNYAANHDFG